MTDNGDNMKLWNQVCTTDPDYTKEVNQRGGFTSISAQYQLKTATEQWGPYGSTWGVKDCEHTLVRDAAGEVVEAALHATFWYPHGEFTLSTDIAYRPGNDTRKKLLTDLTTKALSKLGFSADVFMGLFDDNKYVDDLKAAKAANAPPPTAKALLSWVRVYRERAGESCGDEDLRTFLRNVAAVVLPDWTSGDNLTPRQVASLHAAVQSGQHDPATGDKIPPAATGAA